MHAFLEFGYSIKTYLCIAYLEKFAKLDILIFLN